MGCSTDLYRISSNVFKSVQTYSKNLFLTLQSDLTEIDF